MSNPKEIHHIAEDLANAVFNTSQDDFLRQMRLLHRTNQQMFAGLVLLWMQDYVNYDTDGRNQYSVGYFKKMLDAFMAAYPDEPLRKGFPLV